MARTKSSVQKKKDFHRGHREGSIYQTSTGLWRGQIQVGFQPDGRRKFISKKNKDKQVVLDWLLENQNNIKNNTFVDAKSITLEEWIWNWMNIYKRKSVSDNTYARYISLIHNHIEPEITKLKLKDVNRSKLQNIYNNIMRKGVAYESMKHIHSVFNQSLQVAVDDGLIATNFAYKLNKGVREPREEVSVFTREQQKKIIDNLPFSPLRCSYSYWYWYWCKIRRVTWTFLG